jgi:hypothetical protein
LAILFPDRRLKKFRARLDIIIDWRSWAAENNPKSQKKIPNSIFLFAGRSFGK